jgi:hypothetical protein
MSRPEICIAEKRRERVRAANLNGLDYVEVEDDQQTLAAYFLGKAPPAIEVEGHPARSPIGKANVRIEGGSRIRDLRIVDVAVHRNDNPREDDWLEVKVDQPGDVSPYTLRLVATDEHGHPIVDRDEAGREDFRPFPGFDPRYATVEFSFKPGCPSELDCKTACVCPPEKSDEPEINYLAKDYGSFRQLILDRLALTMPEWHERHVPDLGIALVEMLAYTGDYLSYYQDAVATEAYLDTARKRISVRRHARLVDYILHEGCNARAWLFLEVNAEIGETVTFQRDEIAFSTVTGPARSPMSRPIDANELNQLPAGSYEYFEPMAKKIQLRAEHNEIAFYTWGDAQCCLPRGSTSATLRDAWLPIAPENPSAAARARATEEECEPAPNESSPPDRMLALRPGDYILFEEIIGPKTGNEADADPTHRHVVRLTRVTPMEDPLFRETVAGYDGDFGTPLVEIEWAPEDALPFPLCISAIGPAEPAPPRKPCELIEGISVARGNIILVDHGRTIKQDPPFDPVPTEETETCCEGEGRVSETTLRAGKFRPHLSRGALVFAEPLARNAAASRLLAQDPRRAVPSVQLTTTTSEPNEWWPRIDLLSSAGEAAHFVVEVDNEGLAHLRFGDGDCGRMPDAGTAFAVKYRVGGGVAGNVGAESIKQIVWPNERRDDRITQVRNPLPARGGAAPEPIAEAKLFAPRAFRKELQRAIIPEDYAAIALREFPAQVQRAGAELRWTGSWYSVRVAIDPRGSLHASPVLLKKIKRRLERYRRMGHDVQVVPARYVPLEIELIVCMQSHYLRGHVRAALLDVFQSGLRSNGEPGFFHPDKLSFGDAIYLSRLVAAAQAVEGVESVEMTKLQRRFAAANHEIDHGVLSIGPLEVARLDNDPINPENGVLKLDVRGGR